MGTRKPRRRKRRRRTYGPAERKLDARKWFNERGIPRDRVDSYAGRYGIDGPTAHIELLELGCRNELAIQAYERDGIPWQFIHDGYTGEDFVVPAGTPEWELPNFW